MIKEFKKSARAKLFPDFTSDEFDCHCDYPDCLITYVDMEHVGHLQRERDILKQPIEIVSGFRCTRHNKDVGGKKGSCHLIGKATDIRVQGLNVRNLAQIFEGFDGLGVYPGRHFIHIDSRGYRARWKG